MSKPIPALTALAIVGSCWCVAGQAAPKARKGSTTKVKAREELTVRMHPPLQFDRITLEHGLPQSHILAIAQDQQGFLWFGTQEGLARYSGAGFRVYRHSPAKPESLSSSFITALVVDDGGYLWIGTGEAGLNRYNPKTDSFTAHRGDPDAADALPTDVVTAMTKASDGTIWIGTNDGGLTRLDPVTGAFKRAIQPQDLNVGIDVTITAITEGKNGMLWVGTSGAGLLEFSPTKGVFTQYRREPGNRRSLASDEVTAILLDDQGTLWVGTNDGLDRFDRSARAFAHHRSRPNAPKTLSDNRVSVLFQDRAGRIWVGAQNGLNLLDRKTRRFTRFVADATSPQTLSYPKWITAAFQDASGVLWFGTFAKGLRKTDELQMSFHHYGFADLTANSFLEGTGKGLWVGSYDKGLFYFDRDRQQVRLYSEIGEQRIQLESHWITALHRDHRGVMWIGAAGIGVVEYDPRSGQATVYGGGQNGIRATRIDAVVQDGERNIWMASWGDGLFKLNPETKEVSNFYSDEADGNSISSDYLYTAIRDISNPSVLWLGTAGGGLNRFDTRTQTAVSHQHDPENPATLSHDSVLSLHQDADGVLWIGTYGGGLTRFDPASQEIERFQDPLLADGVIYGILEDDEKRLWMSTNGRGLVVLDQRAGEVYAFDARDGLQGNEFAQGASYESKSGEMFFGGLNGFNAFVPSEIERDEHPPSVVLTGFKLFNTDTELDAPIWMRPKVELGYTDSVFSLEFNALAFADPGRSRYQYMLEGLHDEWITTERPFVTYTNLDGGDYTFRVKAANRHGRWNEEPTTLSIHVDAPPWARWWAYVGYAVILGGIAFTYLRYQASRLEALKRANRLAAVERDLDLTGAVQTGFLPRTDRVADPEFQCRGFYRPADSASGDWWWHEENDGRRTILVGDVTGHGPGPAMVTAAVATAFRVQGRLRRSIDERLHLLNEQVVEVAGGRYHMTMTTVELDVATGKVRVHSAGGLPVVRLPPGAAPKVVPCRGTPLGSDEFVLGDAEIDLAPGERLLIFTDGIPELVLDNGRMLGMRGMFRMFRESRDMPIDAAINYIADKADQVRKDRIQDDDWTFVMVQWKS